MDSVHETPSLTPSLSEFDATYEERKKAYKTTPTLTKYEKTQVLAERATQLTNGSRMMITDTGKFTNTYDIALQELKEKRLPFIIKRPYGNTFEYWKLKDLL
jgi:DNA-directed RNA polymerase subunit K/omega